MSKTDKKVSEDFLAELQASTITTGIPTSDTPARIMVEDTPKYTVYKLPDGTFDKQMKYKKIWTKVPETQDEIIEMYQLMNENDERVEPMKRAVGKEFKVKNFYTNPYESFDEKTGLHENGCTTMFETTDGAFIVTSSLAVYWSLMNIIAVTGIPNEPTYTGMKLVVYTEKKEEGEQILIRFIGIK